MNGILETCLITSFALSSIHPIHSPPGTGKSTLLISVIERYLEQDGKKLLVCAPTNKAISVLFRKFQDSIVSLPVQERPKVVLVGNHEKLLDDSNSLLSEREDCRLRMCHVYLFERMVNREISDIRDFVNPKLANLSGVTIHDMAERARILQGEILARLITLPAEYKDILERLCQELEEVCAGNKSPQSVLDLSVEVHKIFVIDLPGHAVKYDIMTSADVIFCTLCSSGCSIMRLISVDDLIVDEAAAATEPDLYVPFRCQPSRLLIVGDPQQLPATVKSPLAKRLGLDRSLHDRLMNGCGWEFHMLNVQHRMHPDISKFPSRHFYHGRVTDGEKTHVRGGDMAYLLDGRPYKFLQINGIAKKCEENESSLNQEEADAVVRLVWELKTLCPGDIAQSTSADRVRIITFYKAQVTLIQKCLEEKGLAGVPVSTVDSAQGCEADIVLVSFVMGAKVGFLNDDRRMNVALTRAKHQLICVGNVQRFSNLSLAPTLKELAKDAKHRNVIL